MPTKTEVKEFLEKLSVELMEQGNDYCKSQDEGIEHGFYGFSYKIDDFLEMWEEHDKEDKKRSDKREENEKGGTT